MISSNNLKHELLDPLNDNNPGSAGFTSDGEFRGIYYPLRFYLKLTPDLQMIIDSIPNGFHEAKDLSLDMVQAFSTYLHETVHWWQHVGSVAGFIYSLSFPAQTHSNIESLHTFLAIVGAKKSVKAWALDAELAGMSHDELSLAAANTAINNSVDIEYYKFFTLDPGQAEKLGSEQYFESIGHSYRMAYSHVLNLVASTIDPDFEYLPDGPKWDRSFKNLSDVKAEGFFHGSPIYRGPVGLHAIFEGQARVIQMQYLAFANPKSLSCNSLRDGGYFEGVYGEAIEAFFKILKENWPDTIDDPLIGLFLLVCDIVINPTVGFPLDIRDFELFIEDVDPGIRFVNVCAAIRDDHPEFKKMIFHYDKAEYDEISSTLCKTCGYDPPSEGLKAIVHWVDAIPDVQKMMFEKSKFEYEEENVLVRVMISHFISFSQDKLLRPEFFCWAGAWMNSTRGTAGTMAIFLNHLSLFAGRADKTGVYPRMGKDRTTKAAVKTLTAFYANVILYDLTKQWILRGGHFEFQYDWLVEESKTEELVAASKRMFEQVYGKAVSEFEILKHRYP